MRAAVFVCEFRVRELVAPPAASQSACAHAVERCSVIATLTPSLTLHKKLLHLSFVADVTKAITLVNTGFATQTLIANFVSSIYPHY